MKTKLWLLRRFSAAAALESAVVLVWLAGTQSEHQDAVLWGYSASRLLMLGVVGALLLGSAAFWAVLGASSAFSPRSTLGLDRSLAHPTWRRGIVTLMVLLLFSALTVLLIPHDVQGERADEISRMLPVILLGGLLALQVLLLTFRWRGGRLHWEALASWKEILRPAAVASLVLLVALAGVAVSGIGVKPDRSGWYAPGTPVLLTQVVLAAALSAAALTLAGSIRRRRPAANHSPRKRFETDRAIGFGLWLAAFLLWWSQPIQSASYFTAEPVPPNFEFYPYSDSALYDGFAQHILIGTSRSAGLLLHTVYTFFLAFLHLIGGQNYQLLVSLQVAVLAVIPVLVFLIGSRLSNRTAALLATMLVILRERNAIALTNVIEVSHSRLFLSDVPTMTLVLGLVLLLVHWFSRPSRPGHWAAFAGGLLGLLVLIRSQTLLLIPIVLLGVVVYDWPRFQRTVRDSLILLAGVGLMIAPWIWRNQEVSGRFVVDNTEFYIRFLASSYHTPDENIRADPGEAFDDYYVRMIGQITDYVREYPEDVARFFASHFVHNEIEAILYLPLGVHLHDLGSYLKEWPLWSRPREPVPLAAVPWLLGNLGLIALGIGAAVRRLKWVGILPLLVHLSYSLSVVPARLSGWRFILPADWVTLLYYSIGLSQAGAIAFSLLSGRAAPPAEAGTEGLLVADPGSTKRSPSAVLLPLTGTLLFGLLFPAAELVAPLRYPALTDEVKTDLHMPEALALEDGAIVSRADVRSFLAQDPAAAILYGRALYPRFYRRGKYWGDDTGFILVAREYARLQFAVTGSDRAEVYLPLSQAPADFPHAADVLVIGCFEGGHVRALLARIDDQAEALSAAPWNGLTCSAGGQ